MKHPYLCRVLFLVFLNISLWIPIQGQVSDSLCQRFRMAAWAGETDTLRAILDTANPGIVKCFAWDEYNALGYAVSEGHYDATEVLLQFGSHPDTIPGKQITPLVIAAQQGFFEIAELLILYGANLNASGNNQMTPLLHATNRGDHLLMDMLLHYGADPNMTIRDGTTPFLLATMYSDYEAAAILAGYGAHIDSCDLWGFTPLMIAAQQNDTVMGQWLLAMGANPSRRNRDGWSALEVAVANNANHMVYLLISVTDSTRCEHLVPLALLNKNRYAFTLANEYGCKGLNKPVIAARTFGYGILFNGQHLMGTYRMGWNDVRHQLVYSAGVAHRYRTAVVSHTPEDQDTLTYQLQAQRYLAFAGVEKRINMVEDDRQSLSFTAGGWIAFSAGNYKGTTMKPYRGVIPSWKAGLLYERGSFSAGVAYQYINLKDKPIPATHLAIETALVFPLTQYRVKPKPMPYEFK
jgi:uncharacterized protein